jgi:hypothetical protein
MDNSYNPITKTEPETRATGKNNKGQEQLNK